LSHLPAARDPNLPVPADLSERLLAQSEVMEAHIAECGELASKEMVEISGERRAGATGDESGAGAPR
jgi:hypothetical protein